MSRISPLVNFNVTRLNGIEFVKKGRGREWVYMDGIFSSHFRMMDRCHLLKEDGSVGIHMSKLKMLIENNCFVYIPFNESVMKINR